MKKNNNKNYKYTYFTKKSTSYLRLHDIGNGREIRLNLKITQVGKGFQDCVSAFPEPSKACAIIVVIVKRIHVQFLCQLCQSRVGRGPQGTGNKVAIVADPESVEMWGKCGFNVLGFALCFTW